MGDEIGRAPSSRCSFAEGDGGEHSESGRIPEIDRLRSHGILLEPAKNAEAAKDARGVGRELQTGAYLFEPFRPFQDGNGEPLGGKGKRRRQAGDSGAGDNDVALGRRVDQAAFSP